MKLKQVIALLAILVLSAAEASAESAFSFFVGPTSADSATLSVATPVPAGRLYDVDTSLSSDPAFGFRFTQWSTPSPWFGFSLGLSHFEASSNLVDLNIDTVAVPLMLRKMFRVSDEYPFGQIRPYAGLGLIAIMGDATTQYVYEDIEGFGYELKLGVDYMFSRNFSFFAETVYTDASIKSAQEGSQDACYFSWCTWVSDQEEVELDLSMFYLLMGVSRWF